MGVAFHDGTVHECTRVAFVTVADNVLLITLCSSYLLPFLSCRESSASASSKDRLLYLFDNFFFLHVKESFFKGCISADCNIFLDTVCIYSSTMLQDDSVLLLIEWNLFLLFIEDTCCRISKSIDVFTFKHGLLKNLFAVIDFDLCIKPTLWFYSYKRTHFTEAMASALF